MRFFFLLLSEIEEIVKYLHELHGISLSTRGCLQFEQIMVNRIRTSTIPFHMHLCMLMFIFILTSDKLQ